MNTSTANLTIVQNTTERRYFEWTIVATSGPHKGKVVNSRIRLADAIELMHDLENQYFSSKGSARRNSPAAEARRIGASYGVNGEIWDNA